MQLTATHSGMRTLDEFIKDLLMFLNLDVHQHNLAGQILNLGFGGSQTLGNDSGNNLWGI